MYNVWVTGTYCSCLPCQGDDWLITLLVYRDTATAVLRELHVYHARVVKIVFLWMYHINGYMQLYVDNISTQIILYYISLLLRESIFGLYLFCTTRSAFCTLSISAPCSPSRYNIQLQTNRNTITLCRFSIWLKFLL